MDHLGDHVAPGRAPPLRGRGPAARRATGGAVPAASLGPAHPVAAYTDGARLFAGLAFLFGGADRLRTAMAEWYQVYAGRAATTDGLAAHLGAWSGADIGPWWARYVHGRG